MQWGQGSSRRVCFKHVLHHHTVSIETNSQRDCVEPSDQESPMLSTTRSGLVSVVTAEIHSGSENGESGLLNREPSSGAL